MGTESCSVAAPWGRIAVTVEEGAVVGLELRAESRSLPPPDAEVARRAVRQLREYLAGTRRAFTLPLRRPAATTPFQHRVWDALLAIPPGETRTYGELAAQLGTSARAVGGACRRNPLPILVPCHRVVARGGLGGFSGAWGEGPELGVKRTLLALEGGAAGEARPRDGAQT
jgi:methylated-DNA-[protein]-cysteine S-methyltransferase